MSRSDTSATRPAGLRGDGWAASLRVRGTLVAETAVHVGGAQTSGGVDLTVARDGSGQPYVPGTSLAGVLRAAAQRIEGVTTDELDDLFGSLDDSGHASRLSVEHAPFEPPHPSDGRAGWLEVRDHVRIDRGTGAAADGAKFEREVVPAGSTIPFDLTVVLPGDHIHAQRLEAIVSTLLDHLESGAQLGAATTRGLGRVVLRKTYTWRDDWSSKDGVLDTLAIAAGAEPTPTTLPDPLLLRRPIEISIDWEPVGPLMVRAASQGNLVDSLPLTTASPLDDGADQVRLVLPGSSIKGSMRSHAERIVATRLGAPGGLGDPVAERAASHPVIERLFGSINQSGSTGNGATGRIGAVSFDDCHSDEVAASLLDAFRNEPRATDGAPFAAAHAEMAAEPDLQVAQHVSIDRFTGGAASSALFSVAEPWNQSWDSMKISVDELRLGDDGTGNAARFLFLLLLVELATGRIQFGFATTRGFGDVAVSSIGLGSDGIDGSPAGIADELADWATANGWPMDELTDAWRTEVALDPSGLRDKEPTP